MAPQRSLTDTDGESLNSSQTLAVLEVPPSSLVLDVGIGDGPVARQLRERGCRVIGVEVAPGNAHEAGQGCDQLVIADVETNDFAAALAGSEFDVVLLLDVLQRFRDPLTVLTTATSHLKPDGRVIVSVPNATHAALRLRSLPGRLERNASGVPPRDCIHMFDRQAFDQLLDQAGLSVRERLRTTAGVTETDIQIDPEEYAEEVLARALDDEESKTYQFVYVAERASPVNDRLETASLAQAPQMPAQRADRLRAEPEEPACGLEGQVAELQRERARLDALSSGLRERAEMLEEELSQRIAELEHERADLERARTDLAVKDAQLAALQGELAPIRAWRDAPNRLMDRVRAAGRRMPVLRRWLKRIARR